MLQVTRSLHMTITEHSSTASPRNLSRASTKFSGDLLFPLYSLNTKLQNNWTGGLLRWVRELWSSQCRRGGDFGVYPDLRISHVGAAGHEGKLVIEKQILVIVLCNKKDEPKRFRTHVLKHPLLRYLNCKNVVAAVLELMVPYFSPIRNSMTEVVLRDLLPNLE